MATVIYPEEFAQKLHVAANATINSGIAESLTVAPASTQRLVMTPWNGARISAKATIAFSRPASSPSTEGGS